MTAVNFLTKSPGMPYSVVTAQQACSTEKVNSVAMWKITNQGPSLPGINVVTYFAAFIKTVSNIKCALKFIFTFLLQLQASF